MSSEQARLRVLTPRGIGGVSVVAIEGADRLDRAAGLLRRRGDDAPMRPSARPTLARLCVDGEVLDEVLVFDRPDRQRVELHLHGSEAVLGALPLMPREGSSAADRLLRSALGDAQLALALEQRAHPWSEFVAGLADAPDAERAAAIDAARARSRVAVALARPCRVVLCGAQNAGKSTLMNRLLFQDRVLTGDTPGLTRDPVRELTVLDGYPYDVVDTAGEGDVDDEIDRAALARARALRAGDAVRILVVDGSHAVPAAARALHNARTLVVRNKQDLGLAANWPTEFVDALTLSCADPADAPSVREAVGAALRALRGLPPAGPVGGSAALDDDELAMLPN